MRRSFRPRVFQSLEGRHLLTADLLGAVEAPAQGADFALIDVNPTSSTYDQAVSPRDYSGDVSAWYFGYAT